METRFLTFAGIKKCFPGLKPSRLDYLVREGLVTCQCSGHGWPRLYPPEALDQIRVYLEQSHAGGPKNPSGGKCGAEGG